MQPLRASRLTILGLVFVALGVAVPLLLEGYGIPAPVLPIPGLISMIAIALVTFLLGWRVHRWKSLGADGKPRRMIDPILAARTLLLAQALAYAGVVLAGWHLGVVLEQIQFLGYSSGLGRFISALLLVGGGIVMLVIGLVVERFCRVPPVDDGTKTSEKKPSAGTNGTEGEYA